MLFLPHLAQVQNKRFGLEGSSKGTKARAEEAGEYLIAIKAHLAKCLDLQRHNSETC